MLGVAVEMGGGIYVRANALSFPFGACAYDLTALITVLEFVPDPDRVLREAVRVSRRGLLVGVLNRRSVTALARRVRGGEVWSSARFFTTGEIGRRLGRAAGRRLRSIRSRTAVLPPGLETLARWLPFGALCGVSVSLEL
jgi:ubiquinone/menaquinone biosynthesis C-methylase UbiE